LGPGFFSTRGGGFEKPGKKASRLRGARRGMLASSAGGGAPQGAGLGPRLH
jgi:hypothetical protein